MRVPSTDITKIIHFVALDATDHVTRLTGLSGFTVYRTRNGGSSVAMTTPTVTEKDATHMPGVYTLLLDEDMTIGSGNDSEEMLFHIACTGMADVDRTIELYRREVTPGETLTVSSGVADAGFSADSVWDALTTDMTTADSIGKKLADWVLGTDHKVELSSGEYDTIADNVLTRPIDSAESSASAKCLLWMLAMVLNTKSLAGGTVTVKKTDNSTNLFTQVVTQTPSASPVTGTGEAG